MADVTRVQRFQNEADNPFVRYNGAAAVLDDTVLATTDLAAVDAAAHANAGRLRLIAIQGVQRSIVSLERLNAPRQLLNTYRLRIGRCGPANHLRSSPEPQIPGRISRSLLIGRH